MYASIYVPGLSPSQRDALAECASGFSPLVELNGEAAVFNISGLKGLYSGTKEIAHAIAGCVAEAGFPAANVAVARTVDTAVLVSRHFKGVTIVAGKTAAALAKIPLKDFPLSGEMAGVLESWGIRTFEELARLPESDLAARLGQEAVSLRNLARGLVDRPLIISPPQATYEDHVDIDHPLDLLEPLLFIMGRSLNMLCEKLEAHGMAANELAIVLDLDDKTQHARRLRLPFPMRKSKVFLKLLQMDLETHPPQAAVAGLSIILTPAPPRIVQDGLFLPLAPEPEKLELTLARIRALVGEENLGIPELLNTHRPEPFHMSPCSVPPPDGDDQAALACRMAFRYFRPPLAAEVKMQEGRPAWLLAKGRQGRVVNSAGPWRTSGDWWTAAPWNRDEWDVALASGVIYRLYCEPGEHWFIEGSYD